MSSITTHNGDHGQTFTLAGDLVFKNDLRIVIPGMNDELITHLSLIKVNLNTQDERLEILSWLQTCFFIISARVSDPYLQTSFSHQITETELTFLDELLHDYEHNTQLPTGFIIPGMNQLACLFDQARVLVRNIERNFVVFCQLFPQHKITPITLAFLNRLSDLFYIWARAEEHGNFVFVNYDFIKELPQKRSKANLSNF